MLKSESTIQSPSWPAKVHMDDSSIPCLPPRASTRGHTRSRTTLDIPALLPRTPSQSPTRSSTFLPFIGSSRSSSPVRASPADAAEFSVEDTGSPYSTSRIGRKGEGLASWFEGSSAPVNIGLVASPTKEQEQHAGNEGDVMHTLFSGSQESLRSGPIGSTRPVLPSPSASTSRFNFFGRRSPTTTTISPDKIPGFNITEALYPDGAPLEPTWAAFRALNHNAEHALKAIQAAYQEQTVALQKVTSERNIQLDENLSSETRIEHLKAQLLGMADRVMEQERTIETLKNDNEQLRANEVALKSIRVITDHTSLERPNTLDDAQRPSFSRRNRTSDASVTHSIDSAGSTSSQATSIFSDIESGDKSPGSSIACPSPALKQACRAITPNVHMAAHHLRSLTTDIINPTCRNCRSLQSQEVWDLVAMMKAENMGLKEQIQALEESKDDALDFLTWNPTELDDLASDCRRMLSIRGVPDDEAYN